MNASTNMDMDTSYGIVRLDRDLLKRRLGHMEDSMRPKVIAVDFDGTLVEDSYPDPPKHINHEVLNYCLKQQKLGAKIVLWTCREGDLLAPAITICAENGLIFDAINENIMEGIDYDCRKVYADEYIDDRSVVSFDVPYIHKAKKNIKRLCTFELLKLYREQYDCSTDPIINARTSSIDGVIIMFHYSGAYRPFFVIEEVADDNYDPERDPEIIFRKLNF